MGGGQLLTGAWSDRLGRKWLVASGLWVRAAGMAVYPTLLAAIGDVAHPAWRASSIGVYRLWRDLGYVLGALVSGVLADTLGLSAAMGFVAAPTFGSGLLVAFRMRETLQVRVVARGRLSWDAR